ncbi:hypothetical protein [Flavobacterium sp. PL12]|uniref:hypothetical protein n=1 Tax=Flavobacterium sp. PL12 TaxID=3071718 RepID=UPI00319DF947
MKKVILLIFFTTLLSCSSDDNNTEGSKNSFSPPAWIQGTWFVEGDYGAFKFTNNDFCAINFNMTSCYGQNPVIIIKETKSATDYKFDVTAGTVTSSYHFRKISSTQIQYVDNLLDQILTKK